MLIEGSDQISIYKNVPRTFMPVFWVEQKFTIDAEKSKMLKYALNVPWYAKLCGVVLIFLGAAMTILKHFKKRCCDHNNASCKNNEVRQDVIPEEVEKPLILNISSKHIIDEK